jgi:hypothetical protein
MVAYVSSRKRSIDRLAQHLIVRLTLALVLLSMTAVGQAQQFVLGTTQIEDSLDSTRAGMAEAFPVVARSSGQVNFISVFLDPSNTASAVLVAVYASNSGSPGRLLSQSAIPNPVPGQWNAVPIPSVQVTRWKRYWVALLGLNGQVQFRDRPSNCYSRGIQYSETSQQTNLTSLPAIWSGGSQRSNCDVSMFASGTLSSVSVTLSPGTAALQVGQPTQFTATVSGTADMAVTWTTSGGTVTSAGRYTAPSSAGNYTVTATSAADPSKSASASVTVSQPNQISISISPTSVSVPNGGQEQFSASLSGTSNTAVIWSDSGGNITTSGLYTAPKTAGTYTVTALSAADQSKSASSTVIVSPPQTVTVSISPTTIAVPEKWQEQFAAAVSGSSNTAVSWAVTQGSGTITTSGLFTAPQAVETDVITATSQADTTKSASATITVPAPHSVNLSWSPSSSPGISAYKLYRGNASGGPYSLLTSGLNSTAYTDSNVLSGSSYYYVTTAVDSSGQESAYSGEAKAVIPMP